MLRAKRVYDPPSPEDGKRILDRLWPRLIKKENARIDAWLRDIAPSMELPKWFFHDPAKWQKLRRRYRKELEAKEDLLRSLKADARKGTATLLFAAKDTVHVNAQVLKEMIETEPGRTRRAVLASRDTK